MKNCNRCGQNWAEHTVDGCPVMPNAVTFNSVVDAFEKKDAVFKSKLQALYDLVDKVQSDPNEWFADKLITHVKQLHSAIEALKEK